MDPAWVVLDRSVRLVASTGEKTTGGGSTRDFVTYDVIEEEGIGGGDSASKEEEEPTGLVDWVREGLVRLVPELAKPPHISTLSLHVPATPLEIRAQLHSVLVPCADKNLLVLCTGPEALSFASSGRYLVYDADAGTLIVAPPIDWREFREIFGRVPAIVRRGQGSDFTLALVVVSNLTWQYSLLLWSPSTDQEQWVQKEVNLPADVLQCPFMTDVSFSFLDSWACWVDLYFGMLTLNLLSDDQLQFVSLPEAYVMDCLPMARGRSDVHSTMGCVNGVIKFLSMDGYYDEDCPKDKVNVTSWTLQAPTLWKWRRDDDNELRIADLWADEMFLVTPELPRHLPMCPVLSLKEPNTVFFFFSDIAFVDGHVATKGEYVLSLNMQSKKVQSWSKCPPERSLELIPSVIATEFCAYLQSPCMDDQGNVTCRKREGARHSSGRAPRKQK